MKINKHEINGERAYIIAEIGNNHNGSLETAVELVDLACKAGADAVKFQMRNLDEVYRARTLNNEGEDLGTEYVVDLLRKFELDADQHRQLFEYCKIKGITYFCTPWDPTSVDVLESFDGIPVYKVASADLTNLMLLNRLSLTRKPLILSTGMSTSSEIQITIDFLNKRNVDFALLHCNSTYPAPFHDINLRWLEELRKMHSLVGYSGHERGINVSLAAVALGACIIERHFTLDRAMEGPDHAASLTYIEFKNLVEGIRQIEVSLGEGNSRKVSQGEMINRENLSKSLVAAIPLKKGTKINAEHIKIRSPGQGLSPQRYEELLGKILTRDLEDEDFFYQSDLDGSLTKHREYRFKRPWGVPVRYHDFSDYESKIKPDLWEFHLSYSDMKLNPKDYLTKTYDASFVVHAPELFMNSHLMDLASDNEDYLNTSLSETQRVIEITRNLKSFFPATTTPLIVANVGGFTMDEPLSSKVISRYYQRLENSLKKLDMEGVELIPQTMAPFPWHFGGQRFQNLLVRIEEIVEWCTRLNIRMCFDVSHSALACNYLNYDFYEFSRKIAPLTAHLHLGDAGGLNGEGLQMGMGV